MNLGSPAKIDVAIIGAGVSGLTCADELTRRSPQLRVTLFEASSRLGGRTLSKHDWDAAFPLELGALTFSDRHKRVCKLVARFKLAVVQVAFEDEHYFLRGVRLNAGSFAAGEGVPYRLAPGERGKTPRQLLLHAVAKLVPMERLWPVARDGAFAGEVETARFLQQFEFAGRPLWTWSFRALLLQVLSYEGYALVVAGMGVSAGFGEVNAFDAIWTLLWEIQPGQKHFRFVGGYEGLAQALQRDCAGRVNVALGRRVSDVRAGPDGLRVRVEGGDGPEYIETRAVVFAVSPHAIRSVGFDQDLVGADFWRDLDAISPVPASKLFLAFEGSPRARGCDASHAHIRASVTDLPLRQVWRHDWNSDARIKVLMASFADEAAQAFWRSMSGCEEALIDVARQQLHAMDESLARAPIASCFVDWGADPYGGAWHAWKPGVRSWEARARIAQPNPNQPVFFCGEAFARAHGWVEEALETVETLLEQRFDVTRPIPGSS